MEKIEKPWGYELIFAHTDKYVGKILYVKAGEALSKQYHEVKDETLYLDSGLVELEIGPLGKELEKRTWKLGESIHVPPKTVHRITAKEDSYIIEVSTTELDDVVRLDDRYGRADNK